MMKMMMMNFFSPLELEIDLDLGLVGINSMVLTDMVIPHSTGSPKGRIHSGHTEVISTVKDPMKATIPNNHVEDSMKLIIRKDHMKASIHINSHTKTVIHSLEHVILVNICHMDLLELVIIRNLDPRYITNTLEIDKGVLTTIGSHIQRQRVGPEQYTIPDIFSSI